MTKDQAEYVLLWFSDLAKELDLTAADTMDRVLREVKYRNRCMFRKQEFVPCTCSRSRMCDRCYENLQ